MQVIFKASKKVQDDLIDYYKDFYPTKPQYTIFQAKDFDTTVTLYESGKVQFQGKDADLAASIWVQMEKNENPHNYDIKIIDDHNKIKNESSKKKIPSMDNLNIIGSDEVGTGDYFGPIVVTASLVTQDKMPLIKELGVKDSKVLTDEKIIEISPKLIKEIPHITYILDNPSFNKYTKEGYNMNKMKAILHNKVLFDMKQKYPQYDKIVVDEFAKPKNYFEYLKPSTNVVKDITFITKAESISSSVATSSIISRYIFLKEMKKLNIELGIELPKGASDKVDIVGAEIVKKYGIEKLNSIAKTNFKNTDKIKNKIDGN